MHSALALLAANLETNYFIRELRKLLEKLFVSLSTVPVFNVLFYFTVAGYMTSSESEKENPIFKLRGRNF